MTILCLDLAIFTRIPLLIFLAHRAWKWGFDLRSEKFLRLGGVILGLKFLGEFFMKRYGKRILFFLPTLGSRF